MKAGKGCRLSQHVHCDPQEHLMPELYPKGRPAGMRRCQQGLAVALPLPLPLPLLLPLLLMLLMLVQLPIAVLAGPTPALGTAAPKVHGRRRYHWPLSVPPWPQGGWSQGRGKV